MTDGADKLTFKLMLSRDINLKESATSQPGGQK